MMTTPWTDEEINDALPGIVLGLLLALAIWAPLIAAVAWWLL